MKPKNRFLDTEREYPLKSIVNRVLIEFDSINCHLNNFRLISNRQSSDFR